VVEHHAHHDLVPILRSHVQRGEAHVRAGLVHVDGGHGEEHPDNAFPAIVRRREESREVNGHGTFVDVYFRPRQEHAHNVDVALVAGHVPLKEERKEGKGGKERKEGKEEGKEE
jgi:hypothetical protein